MSKRPTVTIIDEESEEITPDGLGNDIDDAGTAEYNARTFLRDAQQSIITEHLSNTGDINFATHNHVTYNRDVSSVLEWLLQLSTLDFGNKQLENIRTARKAEGTGRWLLRTDQFRQWRDGDKRTLWCHGIPGAGKTILTSIIVDQLMTQRADNGTTACLYVYFDHREQKRQDVKNLFPNLLAQLVRARDHVSREVNNLHQAFRRKGMPPTPDEYLQVLASEIKSLYRVYIVVDALDECAHDAELNTRNEFVGALRRLPKTAHLLFTSRLDQSIRSLILPDDNLDVVAQEDELKIYVRSRICGRADLKKLVDDKDKATASKEGSSFMEKVVRTVAKQSDRMFLLARLHMDFLESKISIKDLEAGICNLPQTPDKVYQLALQRIAEQETSKHALAIGTLRWLVFAQRPLTMAELLGALAANSVGNSQMPQGLVSEDTLTSACAGLLVVDPVTGAVKLAHYTTREYLENNASTIFDSAVDSQSIMAETCLVYLLSKEFQTVRETPAEIARRKKDHPFHSYAADHWGNHLHMTSLTTTDKEQQKRVYKLARQFLFNASAVNSAFKAMSDYRFGSEHNVNALHVAAYFGLDKLTRLLLKSKRPFLLDDRTQRGETALHWATFYRNTAVVATLVAAGASANICDCEGKTPVLRAVMNEDLSSLNALLLTPRPPHGQHANLEVQDNSKWTPLRWAAAYGRLVIVEKLLSYHGGIDIDAQDEDGWTALQWANARGHDKVVELLIQRGASINTPAPPPASVTSSEGSRNSNRRSENGGWNLLFWASRHGQLRMVRRIVENNTRKKQHHHHHHHHHHDGGGGGGGSNQVVVDLDATDAHGWTPLRMAVEYGHGMVAWLLIQAGADVNKADESGWTPLHAAAANNGSSSSKSTGGGGGGGGGGGDDKSIAWLLLESGAGVNVEPRTKLGWTPLHVAAFNGKTSLVWLLLEKIKSSSGNKARVNTSSGVTAKTKHGETPLHLAARAGHGRVVSLILRSLGDGADPCKEVLNNGRTALHCAIEERHLDVVRQLLDHTPGLIHVCDDEGGTPLHYAASNGALEIAELLGSRLAGRVDEKDISGNTPLHRAAMGEHVDMVTFLAGRMGADVNALNRKKCTPLHAAANKGNMEVVRLILAFGRVDTQIRDRSGMTAWEIITQLGHVVDEF